MGPRPAGPDPEGTFELKRYLRNRPESPLRTQIEMLFGHLERFFDLDRRRLRGLSGTTDEILLAATAENLRPMAKLPSQLPLVHRIRAPA